jgi:5-methylcytosine-specific restriction endonuclease McrA
MKQRWTETECEYLKANYGRLTPQECADYLSRPLYSVKNKARRMKVARENHIWTDHELKYIKENYTDRGLEHVCDYLGLSKNQVTSKARELGVKISPKVRGKITTRINTGRKMSESAKRKIGAANRRHYFPNTCVDCGKILSSRSIVRCRTCNLKTRRGENHNWWKGGVSVLRNMIMHELYPKWRLPIMERDNFQCQDCGTSGYLEVHHLRLFHIIRDTIIAENPHLSLKKSKDRKKIAKMVVAEHNMEDGITLCRACHAKRHWETRDELLGTPNEKDEGNQQPSASNVISLVDAKVQRLTGEDSQPISPTRASRTVSSIR